MRARLLAAAILAALAVLMSSLAVAGPLEDGTAAYNKGDFATAAAKLREAAEEGDAEEQRLARDWKPGQE